MIPRLLGDDGCEFAVPSPVKTSVIVVNWNGRQHLTDCLSALANQTISGFETILVDNASGDDSVDLVRSRFPWVKLVLLGENHGFSGGNSAGLASATGEAIVLLNNDTRPLADWLEHLLRCVEAHPEAGIIASHLTDWEGRLTDSAGDGLRVTGRGYARHRGLPAADAPPSGPVFGACAGAALYRRTLIEDVGFLDEDFFLNFEDTDLAARARLKGWGAWFCREAVVRHRVSASQVAWSKTNTYYGARNHIYVCIKCLPAWTLIKFAPLIGVEAGAMALRASLHGRMWAYLRGLGAGLMSMRRLLQKRKAIHRGRRVSRVDFERQLHRPRMTPGSLWRLIHP